MDEENVSVVDFLRVIRINLCFFVIFLKPIFALRAWLRMLRSNDLLWHWRAMRS